MFTRNGYDFTARFPKIAAAVESLSVRSCIVDGEAIVVDERGLSVFDALRFRLRDHAAVLCAFDLIELDGEDLRGRPLEHRKGTLADLLRGVRDGIAFNRHYEGDGAIIFKYACTLGWCRSGSAPAASTIGSRMAPTGRERRRWEHAVRSQLRRTKRRHRHRVAALDPALLALEHN